MTEVTPYLLKNKPIYEVIAEIEKVVMSHELSNAIAIYDEGPLGYLILSIDTKAGKVIEDYSAAVLLLNDGLVLGLKSELSSYTLLFGNERAHKFL